MLHIEKQSMTGTEVFVAACLAWTHLHYNLSISQKNKNKANKKKNLYSGCFPSSSALDKFYTGNEDMWRERRPKAQGSKVRVEDLMARARYEVKIGMSYLLEGLR